MRDVTLLALADAATSGGCGACGLAGACATAAGAPHPGSEAAAGCATGDGAAVAACQEALAAAGAQVEVVTARSDAEIDVVLAGLDGPERPDKLRWPVPDDLADGPRLVFASAGDGQLRHVLRRLVRRYAPAPSKRPADLAPGRTLPDLPAIGILPVNHQVPPDATGGADRRVLAYAQNQLRLRSRDLPSRLRLPGDPADVAKAALHGTVDRLDLLRNDGGSVTAHGVLLSRAEPWSALIEVDDVVLAQPRERVLACAIANADGYTTLDGLPLVTGADPRDGKISVAVATAVVNRSLWGRRQVRIEVRRVQGRAVAVTPTAEVPYLDDGVAGTLGRKRSWWIEPGAWGVFRP